MIGRKRRECCVLGECLLFTSMEEQTQRLCDKYFASAQYQCEEGIAMLTRITEQYLHNSRNANNDYHDPGLFLYEAKKPILEEPQSSLKTRKIQDHMLNSLNKISRDKTEPTNKPNQNKKRMTQTDHLRHQIQKKTQNKTPQQGDLIADEQNINPNYLAQLEAKNLDQLLEESRLKMERLKQIRNSCHPGDDADSRSSSSYPLTDYVSNESSNNESHQERFSEQFPTNFQPQSYKTASNLVIPCQTSNSNYQLSNLINSPKKSKSKNKNLYINKKRVPSWANDLQQVAKNVRAQHRDSRFDPRSIYGVCVVERLDTNVIFKKQEVYCRGSSARWYRHPMSNPK